MMLKEFFHKLSNFLQSELLNAFLVSSAIWFVVMNIIVITTAEGLKTSANETADMLAEQTAAIQCLQAQVDALRADVAEIEPTQNITIKVEPSGNTDGSMALPLETGGEFKGFMDYRTLTAPSSKQGALQQEAVTDEHGFRKHSGRFMVALGTYYAAEAGELVDIELSSGIVLRCITGDVKDDSHTDRSNRYNEESGCIVEFIVDTDVISEKSAVHGDMSHSGVYGEIISITKIKQKGEK